MYTVSKEILIKFPLKEAQTFQLVSFRHCAPKQSQEIETGKLNANSSWCCGFI